MAFSGKAVAAIDIDTGKVAFTEKSASVAAAKLGINPSGIWHVLAHKQQQKTAGGYMWAWACDVKDVDTPDNEKIIDTGWDVNFPDTRKPIEARTEDGTLVQIFCSEAEAARRTGVAPSTVSKSANGRTKNPKGGVRFNFVSPEDAAQKERLLLERQPIEKRPPSTAAVTRGNEEREDVVYHPTATPPLPLGAVIVEEKPEPPKTETPAPAVEPQNDALSIRIDMLGPYLSDGPAGKYFLFITKRILIWGEEFSTEATASVGYTPKELIKAGVFDSEEEFLAEWYKPDSFLRPYCKMRVVDIEPAGEDEERRLFLKWKKDSEKVMFDYNHTGPWWFLYALAKGRADERSKRQKGHVG